MEASQTNFYWCANDTHHRVPLPKDLSSSWQEHLSDPLTLQHGVCILLSQGKPSHIYAAVVNQHVPDGMRVFAFFLEPQNLAIVVICVSVFGEYAYHEGLHINLRWVDDTEANKSYCKLVSLLGIKHCTSVLNYLLRATFRLVSAEPVTQWDQVMIPRSSHDRDQC